MLHASYLHNFHNAAVDILKKEMEWMNYHKNTAANIVLDFNLLYLIVLSDLEAYAIN